ncbi:MAG: SPASM domain-containing protein [Defluviitaleaceae bacterium]|nr:SPASM domain-containing protein [Defluviitaleaceae bacterium]
MKASKYNFTVSAKDLGESNDVLVYNSRSGAMVTLDEASFAQFNAFCECESAIDDKDLANGLMHCGFLIEDDIDELNELRLNMYSSRFATSHLGLIIAPSMDCNFRCTYCFELGQLRKQRMPDDVAAKLVAFVDEKANHLSNLDITWFGGEPLLDMERIEDLSYKFLQICEKNSIEYKANVITNGYLYSPNIAERLKSCKVNYVQITLDGVKEIHDSRRFLECGNGTFDTIIQNLKDTKGILPVALRINVDIENQEQASEILSIIKAEGLEGFVSPYLGHVASFGDNCGSDKCISKNQFSEIRVQFMQKIGENMMDMLPKPKSNFCIADSCNGWVIDPVGDMYKCHADIGSKSKRVSSLLDECMKPTNTFNDYMLFEPTATEKCADCKFLPICMGGCPHQRMNGTTDCIDLKNNINNYISLCAKAILLQ